MHGVSRLGARDGDCDDCSRIACYGERSRHLLNAFATQRIVTGNGANYARTRAITAEVLHERF